MARPKGYKKPKGDLPNERKMVDWERLDLYLRAGCKQSNIAIAFGMNYETLSYKVEEKYGVPYSTYSAMLRNEGEMLLEAAQYAKAMNSKSQGNVEMLKYLGKVRLKQVEQEVTNITEAVEEKQKELMDQLDSLRSDLKIADNNMIKDNQS